MSRRYSAYGYIHVSSSGLYTPTVYNNIERILLEDIYKYCVDHNLFLQTPIVIDYDYTIGDYSSINLSNFIRTHHNTRLVVSDICYFSKIDTEVVEHLKIMNKNNIVLCSFIGNKEYNTQASQDKLLLDIGKLKDSEIKK
jgi:hypothetical protein